MIPLHDDIPTHRRPWVNYLLILACIGVFFLEATAPDHGESLVDRYGMVPARVTGAAVELPARATAAAPWQDVEVVPVRTDAPPVPAVPPWMTLVTCMFLHGGLMHLIGNMLFLYIFGDNVEDRYGHLGYLMMYLGSGIAAGLLHIVSAPGSPIPTVGASGAIAGVMGAYFVMFRHARVMTLIPLGIFTQFVAIPAPFFLGLWFVMQLFSAAGNSAESEGVAFWAHVGGFAAGFIGTWLLCQMGRLQPEQPGTRHVPAWQRRQLPWRD